MIFHYIPGNSFLHRLDVRIKLVIVILFTAAILSTSFTGLLIFSLLYGMTLRLICFPVKKLFKEIRYFTLLILIVILVRSISIKGKLLWSCLFFSIYEKGLISGLLFGWQLILIILQNIILTAVTSVSDINKALEWFLKPIPFIPETVVATMISLTVVLVPLIFDEAQEIMDAHKSRNCQVRKGIIKRITVFSYSLFLKTFLRAGEIAMAMEARCFSENRTKYHFKKVRFPDWSMLLLSTILAVVCFLISLWQL